MYYLLSSILQNGTIRTERTEPNISLMNPGIDRWNDLFDYPMAHEAEQKKKTASKVTRTRHDIWNPCDFFII